MNGCAVASLTGTRYPPPAVFVNAAATKSAGSEAACAAVISIADRSSPRFDAYRDSSAFSFLCSATNCARPSAGNPAPFRLSALTHNEVSFCCASPRAVLLAAAASSARSRSGRADRSAYAFPASVAHFSEAARTAASVETLYRNVCAASSSLKSAEAASNGTTTLANVRAVRAFTTASTRRRTRSIARAHDAPTSAAEIVHAIDITLARPAPAAAAGAACARQAPPTLPSTPTAANTATTVRLRRNTEIMPPHSHRPPGGPPLTHEPKRQVLANPQPIRRRWRSEGDRPDPAEAGRPMPFRGRRAGRGGPEGRERPERRARVRPRRPGPSIPRNGIGRPAHHDRNVPSRPHPPRRRQKHNKPAGQRRPTGSLLRIIWRRPTLEGPCGPTTIGAGGLNCRVRDGNGWNPAAMIARNLIRTRRRAGARGCRGRKLHREEPSWAEPIAFLDWRTY